MHYAIILYYVIILYCMICYYAMLYYIRLCFILCYIHVYVCIHIRTYTYIYIYIERERDTYIHVHICSQVHFMELAYHGASLFLDDGVDLLPGSVEYHQKSMAIHIATSHRDFWGHPIYGPPHYKLICPYLARCL